MIVAARGIFGERGYAATSMDDVAAAAGVSKPLLYAYFGSKDELFAACVREAGRDFRASVRAAAGTVTEAPPDERMYAGLLAVFAGIEQDRDAWDLLYPLEGEGPGGDLGARATYGVVAMTEMVEALMVDSAKANGVADEMIPHVAPMARALAGAVLGLVDWWRRHPDEPKELQAVRAMNFAWVGFEQLIEGRLWLP